MACRGVPGLHLWPVLSLLSMAQGASLEKDKQPHFLLGRRPCWQKINAWFPMSTQLAGHLCSMETRAGPLCLPGWLGGYRPAPPLDLIKHQMVNTASTTFPIHDSLLRSAENHDEKRSPYICEHAESDFCWASASHAEAKTQLVFRWNFSTFSKKKEGGRAKVI